jgi:hypothetical protein
LNPRFPTRFFGAYGQRYRLRGRRLEFEKGRFQLRIESNQTKNEEPILLPLPAELNEILNKLPRKGRLFNARNLRKSFQAACVKVGLGVKREPKVWQYKGLVVHDFRGVASGS